MRRMITAVAVGAASSALAATLTLTMTGGAAAAPAGPERPPLCLRLAYDPGTGTTVPIKICEQRPLLVLDRPPAGHTWALVPDGYTGRRVHRGEAFYLEN